MVDTDNVTSVADPSAWSDAELLQWHKFGKALHIINLTDVKRLLDEGLNVNLQWPRFREERLINVKGRDKWILVAADRCGSPLRDAARTGTAETVKLLLAHGADPDAASIDGATALHESVWRPKNDITVALVEHGVDLNQEAMRDSAFGGDATALQIAIRRMNFEMMDLLLKNGALPDARCVEIALVNQDSRTIKMLSRYGGTPGIASLDHHDSWVGANWKVDAFEGPTLPYDPILGKLRKSLNTWLESPVPANIASQDMLCLYCYNLSSAELPDPSLDTTPVTLKTCPICRVIFDEKLWWRQKTYNEGNRKQTVNLRFAHDGYWGDDKDKERLISVGYPSGHLAQILNKLQGCRDTGTESQGAIALARAWLVHCLTDHRKCSASTTSAPSLPTRVIDVGSSHQEPKLVLTGAGPGIYCALSYCWGRYPFLRTTKATLAKHQNSIPMEELPKTLRDAIVIARQLSIQYIWIDALCIVQDDLDDWAHESKMMASIYQNAVLTIVAAAADDTTKGCFQPRARNRVWPVLIPDQLSTRARERVLEPGEDWWNFSRDFWGARLHPPRDPTVPQEGLYAFPEFVKRGNGPIDTRAWCTQEQFMSSRVLYFSHELYWECRCFVASEARPGGSRSSSNFATSVKLRDATSNYGIRVKDDAELDAILTTWEWEVRNYTRRQITKQSDRLVALAGMASVVGSLVDCEFLAGLWKGKHFCRSLLWNIVDVAADEDAESPSTIESRLLLSPLPAESVEAKNKASDDDDGMFPSWCWASCLCGARQVTYGRWDEHMQTAVKTSRRPIETAHVLSYRVDDIFTPKRIQGTIHLRGRLRKMKAIIGGSVQATADLARNFVRIIPADEQLSSFQAVHPKSAGQDDYQLSESPPAAQWTIPYNIVDEAAPKEWLDHLNDSLDDKRQKRSGAPKSQGFSPDGGLSNLFGSDLVASLQNLEALSIQQRSDQKTPVSIHNRQHFWIKDHLNFPDEEVWCLPIAFWDEVIVGLCLRPTNKENEFRRIGLCNIERSGQQIWEEDVVFESWTTLKMVSVSVI